MATYYVDPVSGSNGNAGTSLGAAWATTQYALDNAVAGDTVRLCATGIESTAVQIDADTNAGTYNNRIEFKAANASGVIDGTRYVIRASASIANGLLVPTPAASSLVWSDVDFDANGNAARCVYNGNANDHLNGLQFNRCRFMNATGNGVYYGGTQLVVFVWCRFTENGGNGHETIGGRGPSAFSYCSFDNNAGRGVVVQTGNGYEHCVFYRNGGDGAYCDSNSTGAAFRHCAFAFNTGDGLELFNNSGRNNYTLVNSVFLTNGGYGIRYNVTEATRIKVFDGNCFHNNTSGETDLGVGNTPGTILIAGDPLFMDTGSGTEDFRLQATSPLLGAGVGGGDIGALGIASEEIGGSLPQRISSY